MADKTYTYFGPLSAVSLPVDAEHPDVRDVQLARGLRVTLPDDNDYVISLVARKYLVPVAEPEATEAATNKASSTTTPTAVSPAVAAAETKTTQTGATATSGAAVTSGA